MSRTKRFGSAALCLVLFVSIASCFTGCTPEPREEIVITIPYNEYIRNLDTNYYKQWLEQQTGLSIKFNIAREPLTADYLRSMFASGYVKSDAFFSMFDGEDLAANNMIFQEFGEKGYILPLSEYAERSTYLSAIFDDYTDYDLRSAITSPDGNMYYMPGFDPSVSERFFQVLWLNENWLKRLSLTIPQTTDELRDVLYAFKHGDPNGNGELDEIPLAGSFDVLSEQSYNFIINAFVYNNPINSRLFVNDGTVRFAPVTDEWREAMKYLHSLYEDGLLSPLQFAMGNHGLAALANDPARLLGGFTSQSVADVIFAGNPELIRSYVSVAPLIGPDGTRNATVRTPLPRPAGVISSNCKNPEAVFKLFDLMLSEEAFLIGRYGEEGEDWVRAGVADTDFYGNRASVRVVNQLRNIVQNKHIGELGPFFAYPQYADGVTFVHSEVGWEYVNARAYRASEPFKPDEYIRTTLFTGAHLTDFGDIRAAIDDYTNANIKAFITGEKDPFDDGVWEVYVRGYANMGIDRLIGAVQGAYDDTGK